MSNFSIDNSYYQKFFTKDELAIRNRILQTDTLEEAVEIWNEFLQPNKVLRNGKPIMDRPLTQEELFLVMNLLCRVDRVFLALVVSGGTEEALIRIATNKWLFKRCREVQRNPDGHLDLWPRAHYKSTIVTKLGIIQELLVNPRLTVLIITYTNKFALDVLSFIKKTFEFNELLKEIFPDVLWKNPQKDAPAGMWMQNAITLKGNQGGNVASVTYSAIGGSQKTGHHAMLLVYDDAVTDKSVTTVENRDKTVKYINTSKNLGSPGQPIDRKWFVGTRYHQDDAYAYLISRGAVIPRIYTATTNGRLDGELVFLQPEEWKKNYLTQDDYTLSCQMFMNPNLISKSSFSLKYLKPYNVIPPCHIFIFVDPATTKNKNSDYTSIAVVGVRAKTTNATGGSVQYMTDKQRSLSLEKFLLDGVRDRMNLSETWDALKNMYLKWEQFLDYYGNNKFTLNVYYEKYGQQRDTEVLATLQERDKVFFEIHTTGGKVSKEDRILRLIPDLKTGNFKIPYFVEKFGDISSWKVTETSPDYFDMTFNKEPLKNKENKERFASLDTFIKDNSYDFGIQERRGYPIIKKGVDGFKYDYTLHFIDEYVNFPYSRNDDILDSISRIYDIVDLASYGSQLKVYY